MTRAAVRPDGGRHDPGRSPPCGPIRPGSGTTRPRRGDGPRRGRPRPDRGGARRRGRPPRALQGRPDPLFDHRLLGTVARATDDLGLRGEPVGWPAPERVPSLDDAASVALDAALWAPVDRVRVSALRQGGRASTRAPARTSVPCRASRTTTSRGELNDNVMAEICAMELMARSSYEHPELPWSFHQSCVRHAADETRHAAMSRWPMVERGFHESILLQHVSNDEDAYEFPECDPGVSAGSPGGCWSCARCSRLSPSTSSLSRSPCATPSASRTSHGPSTTRRSTSCTTWRTGWSGPASSAPTSASTP